MLTVRPCNFPTLQNTHPSDQIVVPVNIIQSHKNVIFPNMFPNLHHFVLHFSIATFFAGMSLKSGTVLEK